MLTINAVDTLSDEQLAKKAQSGDSCAMESIILRYNNTVKAIASRYYAIGFEKGSELTAKVNEQLEKLAKDGTMDELGKKYPKVANSIIKDYSDQK